MSGYVLQFGPILVRFDQLVEGATQTIVLTCLTSTLALLLAVLLAFLRRDGNGWPSRIIAIYIGAVRNTPLLVQIFFLYFGLASVGIRLSSWQAAILSLSIYGAAYMTEILRAGIESVPRGQIEAGHALGLSRGEIFRRIVFGQALEAVYPALVSQVVIILLVTSLASVISTPELTHATNGIVSETFRNFEAYIVTTLFYLALVVGARISLSLIGLVLFPRRRRRLMSALASRLPNHWPRTV